jgi:uncharacterized membrane protein YfcA
VASLGLVAGIASGLFGVGGGIVMVPLLVMLEKLSQHEAHATSLAAIAPIAAVGAATFAFYGHVSITIALALAGGSLVGAPLGAATMARLPEPTLKIAFGILIAILGAVLVVR